MLLGSLVDGGMAVSAALHPRICGKRPPTSRLSSWQVLIALATSTGIAVLGALGIRLVESSLDPYTVSAGYLALLALPPFAIGRIQEYVARCYDWVALALAPTCIFRQFALLIFMGLGYVVGAVMTANAAMAASILAILVTTAGQRLILAGRLAKRVGYGPRRYEIRTWVAIRCHF